MRTFQVTVATVMAVVLLASACGGDDEAELGSVGNGETTTTDQDQAAGDGDDEPVTGDAGSDWCDAIRDAADDEASPIDFDLLGLTPQEMEARLTENVAVLEDWEAKAPPEIDEQVNTMVDAFRTVVSRADEAEWDLATLATDPAFLGAFDAPELESAADDIDAYSRDVCGVDLGVAAVGTGGVTTPSVPATEGGAATEFLETFGLPPNFLDDEQLACVTAELEATFPGGIPSELTLNAETIELFDTVGSACGIGTP
jgi:hypothetical protein